ncbi:hypothetical protein HPPN120_03785 [Helicobacter pylori Puno120]|uniref:hypothetical protein n=1 Tax=Helicobacter pylori TaxID=210 RepID=UPI0002291230|nr:hypothetical protein [Helicobacter pylori]AEN15372.1 hypothetical protein HPPN120_03785 [Helicobacter pylori Puno120]
MLDQDALLNSHEAGVGGLESEILNGFVSFIKSIYECQKKGKDPKEVLKHTATETLKGGAYSYAIASVGSLLGGVMRNNANQVIQNLSNGSMPTMVVVVKLFTRQITKCDALFFSLSQDAIATMKKHNYDTSRYNQKEKDQLCVTVSTLMTLSAFLKVPIIDKHQKLQEKAKRALEIMKRQMDSLESGHYDVEIIKSGQKDFENL